MENKETFTYTYSAKEQSEIEAIRRKYIPAGEDKMQQLRRLDRIPYQKAQIWALTLGILGALILGIGMSLAMTELGEALGTFWNGVDISMPLGIVIGMVGMALVALAYPVYNRVLKKQRSRIAPQILQLTEELMK